MAIFFALTTGLLLGIFTTSTGFQYLLRTDSEFRELIVKEAQS
jgi:hypothetical protein